MTELTPELKRRILKISRRNVANGHVVGSCVKENTKKNVGNPTKGYCLRGAIRSACEEAGLNVVEASRISDSPRKLGLILKDSFGDTMTPCNFSDYYKKAGCLRVLDEALEKIAA